MISMHRSERYPMNRYYEQLIGSELIAAANWSSIDSIMIDKMFLKNLFIL